MKGLRDVYSVPLCIVGWSFLFPALIIYKNLRPSYDRSGCSSKYKCFPIRKAFDCEEMVLELKSL